IGVRRVKGELHLGPDARQRAAQDAQAIIASQGQSRLQKGEVTLEQAIEAVLKDCDRRERRQGTKDFYQAHRDVLKRSLGTTVPLAKLGLARLQEWVDRARKDGRAGSSIRHVLQLVKRMLKLHQMRTDWMRELILPRVAARSLSRRMPWDAMLAC